MTPAQQKERFSFAYVRAVAAAARINIHDPEVDEDSVDIIFSTRFACSRPQRPRLEAQLKCTSSITPKDGVIRFPLPSHNYNALIEDDLIPRILIVCLVPPKPLDWLAQTVDEMVLKRAAFWVNLRGLPHLSNKANVTVSLPLTNVFDTKALLNLLKGGARP